jgi:cytochrome c5
MKKFLLILSLSLIVFACTSKVAPTASTNNKNVAVSEETKAAITAGHTIYTTKCSKCHDAKDVTAFDKKSWEGILEDMIPKAKLNETEAKNVTAYVMANAKK